MLCFNRLLTKLTVSIKLRLTKVIPWEEVTVAPSKSVSHTVCCWDTLRGKYALEMSSGVLFWFLWHSYMKIPTYNILTFPQAFSTLLAVVTLFILQQRQHLMEDRLKNWLLVTLYSKLFCNYPTFLLRNVKVEN